MAGVGGDRGDSEALLRGGRAGVTSVPSGRAVKTSVKRLSAGREGEVI